MACAIRISQGVSFNQPNFSSCTAWDTDAITLADESVVGRYPTALFITTKNNLYVTDRERGWVLMGVNGSLSPAETIRTGAIGSMSLFVTDNDDILFDSGSNGSYVMLVNSSCTGLFVDTADRFYCSSNSEHRVFRQALDDNTMEVVAGTGCRGPVSNMLDNPHGIFVDEDFRLFVADTGNNRIVYFPEGQFDATTVAGFGAPVTCLLNRPTSVIQDGEGYLFIADSGNHRIVRSAYNGFECLFGCTGESGSSASQLSNPHALAFDFHGNILVTDSGNRRVQKFSLSAHSFRSQFHQWQQNAVTVAGGNGYGGRLDQLYNPLGIVVDHNKSILIVDSANSRIVQWEYGATVGKIVAGGNSKGNRTDQLNDPRQVVIDDHSQSIVIADKGNRRVIRWSGQTQHILIDDIDCRGLTIDKQGFLYVSDRDKNAVRRWKDGGTQETLVAGGNGQGNQLNQLDRHTFLFVDDERSVYVSDLGNDRVVKWNRDATEGVRVAGGNGKGSGLHQLNDPQGLAVDCWKHIYVVDFANDRVVRWREGDSEGKLIVGGASQGSSQLNGPSGLVMDDERNLYVADPGNDRIEKFALVLE